MPLSAVFLPCTGSAGGWRGVGTTFGDLHPALLTDPVRENQGVYDVERPRQETQQVGPGLHPLLGELGGGAPAQEPAQGALQDADAAGTRRAGRAIWRAGHGPHPMTKTPQIPSRPVPLTTAR